MKIGLFTDGIQAPFTEALDWIVEHGIEAVEIGTGNFSPAQHCNLDELLESEEARKRFLDAIESRGLMLSALNLRDYPVVSGVNLFFASVVVLINLATDLAYAYLDPRIRYE